MEIHGFKRLVGVALQRELLPSELTQEGLGTLTTIKKFKRYERRKRFIKKHKISAILKIKEHLIVQAYIHVTDQLASRFPRAIKRTEEEKRLADVIRAETKLSFFQSAWILNRNADFFFPQITGVPSLDHQRIVSRPLSGVCIEVDGDIHDKKFKMKADHFKLNDLKDLGIGTISIPNALIGADSTKRLLAGMVQLQQRDWRATWRAIHRMMVETIIFNGSDELLIFLFELPESEFLYAQREFSYACKRVSVCPPKSISNS